MKSLELSLNKRLLIVEYENFDDSQLDEKHKITLFHNGNILKFICKGQDLTEDIVKGLVPNDLGFLFDGDSKEYYAYPDYKNIDHPFEDKSFDTALESFLSAIQSKNYHWGENAEGKPDDTDDEYWEGEYFLGTKYSSRLKQFEESESRTFNPSKCIIFEIV